MTDVQLSACTREMSLLTDEVAPDVDISRLRRQSTDNLVSTFGDSKLLVPNAKIEWPDLRIWTPFVRYGGVFWTPGIVHIKRRKTALHSYHSEWSPDFEKAKLAALKSVILVFVEPLHHPFGGLLISECMSEPSFMSLEVLDQEPIMCMENPHQN